MIGVPPAFRNRQQVPVTAPRPTAAPKPTFGVRQQVGIQGGYGKGVPGVGIGSVIPPGYYDPTRDIELQGGKREAFNTVEDIGTRRLRGENDFTTAMGQSQSNEATSLGEIQRSYNRLAGRQAEQENTAGTLYGGSALASAAARASNQQLSEAPVKLGAERDQGRLALAHQREGDDLNTSQGRVENASSQFGIDQNTLKTAEAIKNGWVAPGSIPSQFGRTNPVNGKSYREFRQGGRTVHEYSDGRKVYLR